jgi:hypothetical protein
MKKYFTLDEWIAFLQKSGKAGGKILTLNSIQAATGLRPAAVKKAVQRLAEKRYLMKLGNRFYANKFALPSLEEAAMLLGRPCYISFESAMEKHGLISQMPLMLTCASTGKPRKIATPLGEIFLHHIKPSLFNNYYNKDGILWAAPEKAFLDYIYINLKVKKGIMALDEVAEEGLNKKRLRKLSQRYPKSVKEILSSWL